MPSALWMDGWMMHLYMMKGPQSMKVERRREELKEADCMATLLHENHLRNNISHSLDSRPASQGSFLLCSVSVPEQEQE